MSSSNFSLTGYLNRIIGFPLVHELTQETRDEAYTVPILFSKRLSGNSTKSDGGFTNGGNATPEIRLSMLP
jgi:hypothetical protein